MAGKSGNPSIAGRSGLVISLRRGVGYFLLVLFLSGVVVPKGDSSAQEQILGFPGVQDERILTVSGPRRYEVVLGERFSAQVFLDQVSPEEVRLVLPELPPGIDVQEIPVLISRPDGVVEVRLEMIARQAGRFIIDSVMIETDQGPWFVPPLLVEAAPSRGASVPFGARWRLLQDRVFQGQSVPVVLEITGIDSFTYPESINVRPPQTGLFEEISGVGRVVTQSVAGVELFTIPVAVFLFTPTSSGQVVLPAASVEALAVTAHTTALEIPVEPLPPAVDLTGAVGRFDYSLSLDRELLREGETGELVMHIEGEGNLLVLDFPRVSLVGLSEVDENDSSDVLPDTESLLGYRGTRTRTLRFQPLEEEGRGSITVSAFSYLDPETAVVHTVSPRTFFLELLSESEERVGDRESPELNLLSLAELQQPRWYRLRDLVWPFFFFLLGPLVFAVVRLLSVRSSGGGKGRGVSRTGAISLVLGGFLFLSAGTIVPLLNQRRLLRAEELLSQGKADVAGVLYDLELQDHPNHAGLHFNRGVLALQADNALATVYHLRRAARLAPEKSAFREALQEASLYFDIPDQLELPAAVRPDFFFLALFAVWTLFWMLLLKRSSLGRSIGLVSLLMAGVFILAGLVWSLGAEKAPEGVATATVAVRRIPDESADPWVEIQPAQPVKIELSYDQFYLIRTGSGLSGWVPKLDIWRLGADDEA
ncbi:Oxygen tolerance [Alkalispirochaeta americana]|uniref:Oxygen tolerance n=1 Tax=Alkalispirochaeta americana TaxID=159291 RepID=A0A1N6UFD2_9SPIO|nr:BatD family protein [Alkalispirochaeta americana]SIQ64267.1 Oxygen tolerance [Alkalispirochaeta americana]